MPRKNLDASAAKLPDAFDISSRNSTPNTTKPKQGENSFMEAGELVARRCATLPRVLTGDGFQQLSDAKVYTENGLTVIERPRTELINMLTYYRHQCLGTDNHIR
jgi:hypothetical protein